MAEHTLKMTFWDKVQNVISTQEKDIDKNIVKGFSSWTCLISNRKLTKEESDDLRSGYGKEDTKRRFRELVSCLATKYNYEEGTTEGEGNIVESPFDGDVSVRLGGTGVPEYQEGSEKVFEAYFRRIRLGRLKDKKLNYGNIETTWLRPFLCYQRKAKVTVSSLVRSECDALKISKIKGEVLEIEKQIAKNVFSEIYKKCDPPLKEGIYNIIVVFEVPDFYKIGLLPIQDIDDIYTEEARIKFNKKFLKRLEAEAKERFRDYLVLLGSENSNDFIHANVGMYYIPSSKTPSLLVSYGDKKIVYGIVSSSPWGSCLRNIANNVLAMDLNEVNSQ